jgi:hypothetical protein
MPLFAAKTPLLSRGGVAATSRKISRSTLYGADGVVLVNAPRKDIKQYREASFVPDRASLQFQKIRNSKQFVR